MRFLPVLVALACVAGVGVLALVVAGTPATVLNEEQPIERFAPPGDGPVRIDVREGESAEEIGRRLEQAGVIRSARAFRVLVALRGVGGELVAGEYEFDRGLPASEVIERLVKGETASRVVTIPEGLRKEEIGELLERRGVVSKQAFLDALRDETAYADIPAVADARRGFGLEGFLFPATYGFYSDATAGDVVRQMLIAFDQQVAPEIGEGAGGLTPWQVVTLASIVEREARVPEERPLIASVFLNRLRLGIPLQADPTVQYALANDPANVDAFGYWKARLTVDDLGLDSTYNTYVYVGLPPGPICNPGLDAIRAVLRPAQTNYLFFVAKPDGSHAFAETLEEHKRNVAQYQGGSE